MSRAIAVEVTQADLDQHRQLKKKNVTNCPIATALARATGGLEWGVSRSGAFTKRYGRVSFPEWVTTWVDNFDDHFRVRPITFSIQVQT